MKEEAELAEKKGLKTGGTDPDKDKDGRGRKRKRGVRFEE